MPDSIKIIQDISMLYELSLSVGSSLDPTENCYNFLRTLISRKSLNFGAIWLNRTDAQGTHFCDLFYIHPQFRRAQSTVTCSHYIFKELSENPYISISSQNPHFRELVHEKKIGNGSYAIFKLGKLGFLKLFASNRPNGFDELELAQLKQVVDKLSVSLDGCFAHIQLKEETENRMEAQKALAEGESKLRRIIDSSLDAVGSVDRNGNIVEWNVQAEKMFGYTREEALGKLMLHLIIPKHNRSRVERLFEEYLLGIEGAFVNKRYEITCVRKSGKEFPAELSITGDKNYANILFVGFLRDITEQRNAAQKIEQGRIRMENLISSLQTGILLVDSDRCYALVNQVFCEMFNIPEKPEDLIGRDCSQTGEQSKYMFVNPEAFVNSIETNIRKKVLVESEAFTMTNGRVLERDYIPLFSGNVYQGHLWQYRDITERQNAQQAIRESEEKYRGILENMELGLLEVDLEDRIIRTNDAFCQMLGYQSHELIGKIAMETFLPESSKTTMLDRTEERKRGISSVYEFQFQRKNKSLIWALISGAPVRNSQGKITGSIGIHFDMTERKFLETELAEAKLVADRARFAERQFLTHMSHEIRTPINAVIGMTHLLYETQPNPTQVDYLNSLRFSADSLLGVIDNILDLSKIDAGEIEFEQQTFDLGYLLKSLLQSFKFKVEEKDIKIFETVDPAIKNLVIGDPTRINQILTNLLGNAVKFTEKGIISLSTILLEHTAGQYLLEFRVHDTGIGIPKDKWATIFEYFKQADVQINRKFGGTGLGLTIVKQLIEMQGGTIRVKSQLGVGSDFIFTLPFGDSDLPLSEQAILPEMGHPMHNDRIRGLHFLLVEDNILNQKLISKTIQTWECTFEVANNGLEALEKTARSKFDIILMDIHMPEMDGCETTLEIRKNNANLNQYTPIFALTAAAMAEEKRRAFEVGMNGFLTKPIAPKMLLDHLLQAIEPKSRIEPASLEQHTTIETFDKINLGYLLELSHNDQDFVQNIIAAFLAETPTVLHNLEELSNHNSWVEVGYLVHTLKPNLAMLGLKNLEGVALLIEAKAKKGIFNTAEMTALTQELIDRTKAVLYKMAQEQV